MNQLAKRLTSLGLSEKQAKVYVASLLLGPAPAQKIAEQAGLSRPNSYDILDELGKMGLISRANNSTKTLFVSNGVNGLKDWLHVQEETLKRRNQQLDELTSDLQQIQRNDASAPIVRFVHGKEGIDAIWAYVLRKAKVGEEIFAMTNHDEVLRHYPDHLQANPKVRLAKKLSSKQFYSSSQYDIPGNPALLKEKRRLHHPITADVTLYEDKAVLLAYGKEERDWSGIIIESKEIVNALRQLFKLAWNNSKTKNVEKS